MKALSKQEMNTLSRDKEHLSDMMMALAKILCSVLFNEFDKDKLYRYLQVFHQRYTMDLRVYASDEAEKTILRFFYNRMSSNRTSMEELKSEHLVEIKNVFAIVSFEEILLYCKTHGSYNCIEDFMDSFIDNILEPRLGKGKIDKTFSYTSDTNVMPFLEAFNLIYIFYVYAEISSMILYHKANPTAIMNMTDTISKKGNNYIFKYLDNDKGLVDILYSFIFDLMNIMFEESQGIEKIG